MPVHNYCIKAHSGHLIIYNIWKAVMHLSRTNFVIYPHHDRRALRPVSESQACSELSRSHTSKKKLDRHHSLRRRSSTHRPTGRPKYGQERKATTQFYWRLPSGDDSSHCSISSGYLLHQPTGPMPQSLTYNSEWHPFAICKSVKWCRSALHWLSCPLMYSLGICTWAPLLPSLHFNSALVILHFEVHTIDGGAVSHVTLGGGAPMIYLHEIGSNFGMLALCLEATHKAAQQRRDMLAHSCRFPWEPVAVWLGWRSHSLAYQHGRY